MENTQPEILPPTRGTAEEQTSDMHVDLHDRPFGAELDAVVQDIIDRYPNGRDVHHAELLRSVSEHKYLPRNRAREFRVALKSDMRITELEDGRYHVQMVGPLAPLVAEESAPIQKDRVELGGDVVIYGPTLEDMLRVMQRGTVPTKPKGHGRRRVHYKGSTNM